MNRCALLLALALVVRTTRAQAEEPRAPNADNEARDHAAQQLFDEGVKLLEQRDYPEACARFAESHRLAPAGGTALDLGYCNEKRGLLASALLAYEDALERAQAAGRTSRARVAEAKVEELRRRVARLRVRLGPRVMALEDLRVAIDEVRVTDLANAAAVDDGEHTVTVSGRGMAPLTRVTEVHGEGATVELVIDALIALPSEPSASPSAPPRAAPDLATRAVSPAAPGSTRRNVAIGLGATGAVLVGAGAVAGVLAMGKHSESNRLCPTRTTCVPGGAEAEDSAHTYGQLSTIGIGVGLALAGAATVLWLTAPSGKNIAAGAPLTWRF